MKISGEKTKALVEFISGFTRSRGSASYSELLVKLVSYLKNAGVPSNAIRIKEYPCDGESIFGNYRSTFAWEPIKAELWLKKPYRQFITSLKNSPTALLFGSAPTDGWIELPLVVYKGKGNYLGKAVLAKATPKRVFEDAVINGGAKAILLSHMRGQCPEIAREPESNLDVVNYLSIPNTKEDYKYRAFGFSLSERKYRLLEKLLEKGQVSIEASVETMVEKGMLQILEIDLTEKKSPYVLIIAHLCHPSPGANDNASGAALALEIAEIISAAKGFPPIKISLVPEFLGSTPYAIEMKREDDLPFLVINLDMVGENQDKTGSSFLLTETPPILPKRYDYLLEYNIMKNIPRCDEIPIKRFYRIPYSAGSDHCPFTAIGISSPFLGHLPDRYYHTDADSPDKVDCKELEWVGSSVLKSLKDMSSSNPHSDVYIKSKSISDFVYYCENIKHKPGSKELYGAFLKAFEAQENGFNSLFSIESFLPSERSLVPKFEGSIGFEWYYDLPETLKKSLKWNAVSLAELITVSANILGSRESTELFISVYYGISQEAISELIDFLVDNGYFMEGEF
ncbi:hypothetical protein AT15_02655 [Kosmotoga arenicorallina S304]|uniref:Peptidase M28 domain-containing protein n=1 Tax=Kosmotoga arenicorallina S304 TaxID=1453497 RepID=A0A182C7S0_9BACT|nr:DUF4910 domain-containing protein [Kosmotoga arenicorallina]OAA31744.1 hypothetical protein AT15_02655 [Kosmotoga arenicorallina S304]